VTIQGLKIIGESINDSISSTRKLYDAGDPEGIKGLARAQDAAGAAFIDVNIGTRGPKFMAEMVRLVQSVTRKPVSIDTPDYDTALAGLLAHDPAKAWGAMPILNSITPQRMDMYELYRHVPFIPIFIFSERCEDGKPRHNRTPEESVETARELVRMAEESRFPVGSETLILDPGIGSIASDSEGMLQRVLGSMELLHADPVFRDTHFCVGLSNLTHMLPVRKADGTPVRLAIENAFLTRAVPLGLNMIVGSTKRQYELLPEGHPALKCLDEARKLGGFESIERIMEFYRD
jgi:5-methyltetrahydrofolate--homocysteine methyltransferase